MRAATIRIDDTPIGFVWGVWGSPSGIVIPPDIDLSDPQVQTVLAEAIARYSAFDAVAKMGDFTAGQWDGMDELTDEGLNKILATAQLALSQTEFTLGEYDRDNAEALLTEIPKMLEKRRERAVHETRKRQAKQQRSFGYVYLVHAVATDKYKIGRTRDPANRRKTFEVKLPFEIDFVCTIPTDDMFALESSLHNRFAREGKRVNGEWFALEPQDVEYIKGLAS